MAEALNSSENVVGGLGAAEGVRVGVVGVDEGADVALQVPGGTVDAAPDLLVGQQGEEALDLERGAHDPKVKDGAVATGAALLLPPKASP